MKTSEQITLDRGIETYVEIMDEFLERVCCVSYADFCLYGGDGDEYDNWQEEMKKLFTKRAETAARIVMTFSLKAKADEKLVKTAIRKAKLQIKNSYYL